MKTDLNLLRDMRCTSHEQVHGIGTEYWFRLRYTLLPRNSREGIELSYLDHFTITYEDQASDQVEDQVSSNLSRLISAIVTDIELAEKEASITIPILDTDGTIIGHKNFIVEKFCSMGEALHQCEMFKKTNGDKGLRRIEGCSFEIEQWTAYLAGIHTPQVKPMQQLYDKELAKYFAHKHNSSKKQTIT